jgi:hypothetical protein
MIYNNNAEIFEFIAVYDHLAPLKVKQTNRNTIASQMKVTLC